MDRLTPQARRSAIESAAILPVDQDLIIRPYTENDEANVIEVVRELQEYELAFEPRMRPAGEIGSWYIENFKRDIAENGGEILVAEFKGNVCGYAGLLLAVKNSDPYEVEYTYAEVSELAVTAALRGKGIGQALLRQCEEQATKAGAKYLRIAALSKNERALKIYRNAGFSDRMTKLEKTLN